MYNIIQNGDIQIFIANTKQIGVSLVYALTKNS